MTTPTGPDLSIYQNRAANTFMPEEHLRAVVRHIPTEDDLNIHNPDLALFLATSAANYFADISEYQQPFDSSYAYPIRMFRTHSGYRNDNNVVANWQDTALALEKGSCRIAFIYPVFVPGQFNSMFTGLKNVFGATCPTRRLVPVIDMESAGDFAGPGNHSAEANAWAQALADYSGTSVDFIRSHGYANLYDFQTCWPQIDGRIPKHTAAYNAQNPGTFAWQYQGGNPAYPAPQGAPRSYAPFGTYVDGNVIYDTIDEIERMLGITATPIPTYRDDDDVPSLIYDASNPARIAVVFGGVAVELVDDKTSVTNIKQATNYNGTVPINTPFIGLATADYNDCIAALKASAGAGAEASAKAIAEELVPLLPKPPTTLTLNGPIEGRLS